MKKIILILIIIVIAVFVFYSLQEEDVKPDLMDASKLTELSESSSEFSFRLFSELVEEDNIFISPYSIHTALLLAYIGSDGETKKEMTEVLQVMGISEEEIKEKALGLKHYLEYVSEETEVSIANAFFLREDVPFLESYKKDGEDYFEAEIGPLPKEGKEVNEWVSDKTEGKIDELIDDGPVPADVIAYLVNAIYFKGIWEVEFEKENTTERTFYGKEEAEVDMMENKDSYLYGVSENMEAVTLEYKDGDYLFHAFMPRDLSDLYENLDREVFESMKPTNKGEITLRLPKFTMEEDLKLSNALQSIGMESAFDAAFADFSRMVDLDKVYPNNVYISEVYHSSFIEVDEKGTEAAAATAVEVRLESAPMEIVVEFNRPFFFVIEEAQTGAVLFMGQFTDPS